MAIRRFLAPLLTALFGLYCLVWSLIAASSPPQQRGGAAFLGVLFLLLTFVYARILNPRERPRTDLR